MRAVEVGVKVGVKVRVKVGVKVGVGAGEGRGGSLAKRHTSPVRGRGDARHLALLLGHLPLELGVDLVEDEPLPPQAVDALAQPLVARDGLVVLLERRVEPRQMAVRQLGRHAGYHAR